MDAADLKGNVMEPFQEIVPALILPGAGGIVESRDGVVRLVITPGALPSLTENPDIEIMPITVLVGPDAGDLVGSAYEIVSEPDFEFLTGKTATLRFRYPAGTDASRLAMYHEGSSDWTRLGGSVESGANQVRVAVRDLGVYALVQETTTPMGSEGVSDIQFSNRALFPRLMVGGPPRLRNPLTATTDISFQLGAPSEVRVELYDRTGRLIRVLEQGRSMGSGRQIITWDGRDADNDVVRSGLYIVVIEAGGEKAHRTLAVVNN